jgi:GT2 family glycosyltransferase
MKLSVVIVNYNVKYYLEQCLDSLFKSIKNIDSEVFVVDNCSTDDSVSYLKSKFEDVIFIENTENVGFSRANNQAIDKSQGEYILLLNPDTVVGESTIESLFEFIDGNKRWVAGALGVKMINGFGEFLPESKRGFPSPWNSFTKMTGLSKLFPKTKTFGGYHLRYLDENEVHIVDILAGAFMLLRHETIEKVGSLDNRFFMYGEDIDLSFRISKSDFAVYYVPVPIIHYKGESTKKDIRYVKRFYEAMLIFFDKHFPDSNRFFKLFIRLAVRAFGFFSATGKMFGRKGVMRENNYKEVIFNTDEYSYDQIIDKMEKNTEKNVLFRIFHPETGITIDADKVILRS